MAQPYTLTELIEFLEDIRDEYSDMAEVPISALDEGANQYVVVGADVDEDHVWLSLEEVE